MTPHNVVLEWAGPKRRAQVKYMLELGWGGGYVLLPITFYFVRHFRWMQLIVFFYELIFIYWIWKTPESPSWLLLNGKYQMAEKLLVDAIIMNQKGTEADVKIKMGILRKSVVIEENERKIEAKKTLIDLWRSRILFKYTISLYFIWFAMSFVSYGFTYNASDIGGSVYITLFFFGLLDIIINILMYFTVDHFKRKTISIFLCLLGAAAIIAMIPFTFVEWGTPYRMVCAILGKFFLVGTWRMIYLQSAEIFPTGLRQLAMGSCSVASRFASILAPFTREINQWTHVSVSFGIYGILGLLATLLIMVLPETKNQPIPNTIREAERRKSKKKLLETDTLSDK